MKDIKNTTDFVRAEQLKLVLVKKLSAEYASIGTRLVHQAVNEAFALASADYAPLLLLPLLAEEKVQKTAARVAHQRVVLHTHLHAVAA